MAETEDPTIFEDVGDRPSIFRRATSHLGGQFRAYGHDMMISAIVLIAVFVFLLPNIVHTVPAGHVGVLWKRFGGGTVTDHIYREGMRFTWPWDVLTIYDTRLQQVERRFDVLSSDGLHIELDIAWRYRLLTTAVGKLHKYVGLDYQDTLIAPTIGARARDVIALYQPEEIYTASRLKIQREIAESVRYELLHRFDPEGEQDVEWCNLEDVLIKGIVLPDGVQEAIVKKNAAFHELQAYSYRIDKEQKETERKRIEAIGIRNFQEIVSSGMSEAYLRWRGIEATLELARSPNAKVVVVGGGKTGLPLILNTEGSGASPESVVKLSGSKGTGFSTPLLPDLPPPQAIDHQPPESQKKAHGK